MSGSSYWCCGLNGFFLMLRSKGNAYISATYTDGREPFFLPLSWLSVFPLSLCHGICCCSLFFLSPSSVNHSSFLPQLLQRCFKTVLLPVMSVFTLPSLPYSHFLPLSLSVCLSCLILPPYIHLTHHYSYTPGDKANGADSQCHTVDWSV